MLFMLIALTWLGGPIFTKSASDDGIWENSKELFKNYRHTNSVLGAAHASFSEYVGAMGYMLNQAEHPVQTMNTVFKSASDFAKFPDKSKEPQKCYTWDEVARFDGQDGRPLYIVMADCVYDFTDFAALHPGGPAPLKKHAGQDATALLCNTGLPSDVLDIVLLRFKVGYMKKA